MKKNGIFIKVFTYTTLFLILIVCVTVGLFSQQFVSFYNTNQTQQLYTSYQSLYERLNDKSGFEIIKAAEEFYLYNQSFTFYIRDNEGIVIFTTPDIDTSDDISNGNHRIRMSIDTEYTLFAVSHTTTQTEYGGLIQKSLFALVCMLTAAIASAFIFARQITNPIKRLAVNTKKMANLEEVMPIQERRDELGDLSRDVHAMYAKLKDEIIRRREMEETQRYFFSAASHELKTPIASTSVLLEGMLENVGDYKDHTKYLKECIKLMDAQTKTISEILEVVNLSDGKIILNSEKLNIKKILSDLLPSFNTLIEANGQQIHVDISDEHFCYTDKKMLNRVLSNVILNAVQNTPYGGEIRVWGETNADQHRVCVLNTGSRIDDDILPKLFDPFFRADKARSRKNGNSGLGLTIIQKTLETIGVDFSLENAADGVLFWFELPEA